LKNPNPNQTHFEWREETITMGLLTGDFFMYGEKPIGFNTIGNLYNLPANVTDVLVNDGTNAVVGYQTTINNKTTKYELDEVWHGKLYNPTVRGLTTHRGLSPLQASYRSLVADNELVTAQASFFRNKGVSGIISSASDILALDERDADILDEAMRVKLGGASKSNGVVTTGARVAYTPIGMSPSDLDMVKSGDVKLRDLCMVYGVDSKLLGDPKASTYNNVNEAEKQLYTNAVIPVNDRVISYLNRFVVPAYSQQDNLPYVIKQDTSKIDKVLMLQKLYDISEEEAVIVAQTISNENGTGEQ
jgi:HK97 family phage portal protein